MRLLIALALVLTGLLTTGCISCDSPPPPAPVVHRTPPLQAPSRDAATMQRDAETLISRLRGLAAAAPDLAAFYTKFRGRLDAEALREMGLTESEMSTFGYLAAETETVLEPQSVTVNRPAHGGQGPWSITQPMP